ncbi:hypothetical protein GA0074695_4962 [Micromonospora viridifaciens]|uniref:Uncharacterized protein n=1 Tax=Micromonospora viridifaciens TaxID=1881 RepID=A0A1C4Z222_MICVI|nr:hypothetical protein [Micromonospora viridifaciens]SCF26621.1 hypothetical protein GA0074695_4962 [Micromonospora viridifaciens]
MIRLIENVGDRLLGLVIPQANAQAGLCACEIKGYIYQSCGCSGGYIYKKKRYCDGCNLGAWTGCENSWITC